MKILVQVATIAGSPSPPSESEGIRGTALLGSAKYDATDLSGSSITDKHKLEGWYSLSCSCHVGGCNRNCGVM